MTDNDKLKLAQTYYIFPCLVYMKEKLLSGELTEQDLAALVNQNVQAHGHEGFKIPEDWQEQLPHLVNRFGWRIFELPKLIKQQKEESAQRKLQKKQERIGKPQDKGPRAGDKPPLGGSAPGPSSPSAPQKKKVVIRKKPTQE
ncbi:MAG: hypothetical protein LBD13_03470 [Spirochaetaceae bacterium]|jgi:hypothetical protein|nr:hypothetical protein [Spirochaetaceae bacterium]